MKAERFFLRFLTAACALLTASSVAVADALLFTGASGTDYNWNTGNNWTNATAGTVGTAPATTDDVWFGDDGIGISYLTSDMTIQSLTFTNTVMAESLQFDPGVTLTVTSANTSPATYMVGTPDYLAVDTTVTNTVTGPGSALVLDNPNNELMVREGYGSSGAHMATLDLSGLDTFSANLNSIQVGVGNSSYRRAVGTLFLARTNTITVTGAEGSPGIFVGDNSGNNNGNSSISDFELGQQNDLNADYIRVGGQKQQGQMLFNPAFTSPTLQLRGSGGGTNRVAYLGIGDEHHQGSSGNPTTGRLDLSGGTADILADTVYVGRSQTGSGQSANGFLTMSGGTLDANTVEIGYEDTSSSSRSYTVAGTATFNGTQVVVNNLLRLGRDGGATPPQNATLVLNGGSVDVNGAFAAEGVVDVSVTNGGVLNLPPGSALLASSVTVDGGAISNVDILQASNSLSIVNGGVITSPTVFDMGDSGSATWDVSSLPGGGITASNQFSGAGALTGDLIMPPGSVLIPGESGGVNLLNLYNNLTLDGATLEVDLSNSGLSGNDSFYVYGNLTIGATNDVRLNALNGALDTLNPYPLVNYYGTLTGGPEDFHVTGAIANSRYTFTFSTSTPTQIQLLVGGSGSANLVWTGDGLANTWDLKHTANWNNGGSPDPFYNLDNVTFDDTGSTSPAVNLSGTLVPGSLVMSNNTSAYVFAGSGALAGGSLTNYGAGGLTISNDGTNDFNVIDVENGNVTLAGGSANISADGLIVNNYSGVGTVSATIANTNANDFGSAGIALYNGALIFDQTADATLFSPISGSGTVTKQNTNTLTLSGNNSGLTSPITVIEGTLKAGSGNVAGSGGLIVTNGGALDINGADLSSATVTASGAGPDGTGAIVNNGPQEIYAFGAVVLVGDTTFGGTGRWDIRGGDDSLNVNGMGYNITKVGINQVALVGTTVDPTLGNVDIQEGTFAIQTSTIQNGGFGAPSGVITVHTNAFLNLWNLDNGGSNPMDKVIDVQDGGTVWNNNGSSTLAGPITTHGNGIILCDGGTTLNINSVVDGTGGLTLTGAGTLVLNAANTYSGATMINNGMLMLTNGATIGNSAQIIVGNGADLDATADGTLTLSSGQTLGGSGTVHGNVVAGIGSTVAPGASTGTLTVSGDVTLGGTTVMEIDTASTSVNDQLMAANITYGGDLVITNIGGAITGTNTFQLFSGTLGGTFDNVTTPQISGVTWDTSKLGVDGTIIAVGPAGQPALTFTMTGGNTLDLTWPTVGLELQQQTNAPGIGLGTNWETVTGSTTTNRAIITLDPNLGSAFYRLVQQ